MDIGVNSTWLEVRAALERAHYALLEGRVVLGRTPIEAAGERWFALRHLRDSGVLSMQSYLSHLDYIAAWLREKLGSGEAQARFAMVQADGYERFLSEQMDTGDPQETAKLDRAFHAWRARQPARGLRSLP